jgi:hypothetical protein
MYSTSPPIGSQNALPPTPPMHSDFGFDHRRSPSTTSNSGYLVVSAPAYYLNGPASAINSVEPLIQRQHVPAAPRRVSMPAGQVAYNQPPFNGAHYHTGSVDSYYSSPLQSSPPHAQISSLYYQRPIPQVCPRPSPLQVSTNSLEAIPARESHHNIRCEPLATPSLHLAIICCSLSSITRQIHLSDV